jgi:large repetitive protein
MNRKCGLVSDICLVLVTLALCATTARAGLIGHWKFDEGSGTTAADSSANGNTATDSGPGWLSGVSGNAVDDPRFSLADSTDLILSGSVPFTISFWIKPPDSSQSFTCYAGFEGTGGQANDSYAIKCNGSDSPQLTPSGTTAPDTIWNYSDSGANWVHVVGVHEPGVNSRMYIDGAQVATGSAGSIPNPANHDFTIGSYPGGGYGLDGAMDDVQVYDTALSAADVLELYGNPGYALGDAPVVAPAVVSVNPADNATVATPASLAITFDADITNDVAGSITVTNLSSGATDVMGASELAFNAAVLTITPDPALANGTPYAVLIDTNAIKSIDNGLHFAGYTTATNWNFTTTNPDSTKPGLVPPFSPADGALDVPVGASLVAVFDEPIAKGTGNIVLTNLTDGTGTTIPVTDGQVTIVSSTNLTINPSGGLAKGKEYALLIDNNVVKDGADNFFDGIGDTNTWNFTTVAPGLIGHWKFDEGAGTTAADSSGNGNTATDSGAGWVTGVASNAVDDPRFSLADSSDLILSGSVPFTISFWIKPPDDSQSFTCYAGFEGTGGQANDSYAIKCNGSDSPQLTPSGTTAPDTIWNYSDSGANWVHVVGVHEPGVNSRMYIDGAQVATGSAGSIPSPANHDFTIGSYPGGGYGLDAAMDDVQVYEIALSDADVLELYENPGYALGDAPVVPPAVVSVDPADNATVATPASLTITFDADITNDVAGSITVTNLSSGATDVMGASELAFNAAVLTITPDPALANGTPYAVLIDTNAIKSIDNGLHFAGYTTGTNWNFTTTNPDTTKPGLIPPFSPADGATDVAVGASLVAVFDEPIAKGTGNIVLTNLTDGLATTIPVTDGQVTIDNDTNLTINPSGGLAKGKDYAVLIDNNVVKDGADNFFDGISDTNTWNFRTLAPGLIGHWKFDEGSGTTAADSSGNDNTATDTGASWVTGVASNAVDDPRFSLADSTDLILSGSVPFTISFWIKPPDSTQNFTCYAGFEGTGAQANDSYAIKCNGTDSPQLTPSGTTAPDTIWNYSDSGANWVHVVGVHEPGVNSRLYIDGASVATGSAGAIPNPANHDFTVGSYPGGSWGLDASMDDVQVYDKALSDADVLELYNNPGYALGDAPVVAPEVVSTDPVDNATVATPASVSITFDTAITNDPAGNITLTNLTLNTADVMGASELSFSSTVLTITPDPVLANGTPYAVLIDTNAIKSIDNGLHFAGYTTATNWNFTTTTPDSTKPGLIPPFSPADGATDVDVGTSLVAVFDEPIAKGTGNIVLTNLTDSSAATIPVTDGQVTIVSDTNLMINPSGGLAKGKNYAVLIGTNSVKDLAHNFFDGITDTNTWDFTTVVPGLVGHWTFNENSGTTAADGSPFGNDLVRQGSAGAWVSGKADSAYNQPVFEPADSSDMHITGAITLAAWVKPNAALSWAVIAGIDQYAGSGDMYALKTATGDTIQWFLNGVATVTSTDTLSNYSASRADGWVHVVGVYEPGVVNALYINGVLDASGGGSGPISLNANPFRVGAYWNNSGGINAAIDDVQLYDFALSFEQVQELHRCPGYTWPVVLPRASLFILR